MSTVPACPPGASAPAFPYVVVRLMPSVYQHCPVPPGLPAHEILRRVRFFLTEHQLLACVVWAPDHATYLRADGEEHDSADPPRGGLWITVALFPLAPVPEADVLARRPQTPLQARRAWLVGHWTVRTPNAAGQLTSTAPEAQLRLRDDQTYTWQSAPAWSSGTGLWSVSVAADGGRCEVGFEDREGRFEVHQLVPVHLPAGRDVWDWQRRLGEDALGEDWVMRVTRR